MLIEYLFIKKNPMEKKVHLNTLLLMMLMVILVLYVYFLNDGYVKCFDNNKTMSFKIVDYNF